MLSLKLSISSFLSSSSLHRLGASSYLYYGGVFSLTINILGLSSSVAKYLALKVIQIMTISIHNQSSLGWKDQFE